MAKIIELIEVEEKRGLGKDGDPVRRVYQLWTKDGRLVHERDDWSEHRERVLVAEGIKAAGVLRGEIDSLRKAVIEAPLAFMEGEYLQGRGVPDIRGWKRCMEHLIRKARGIAMNATANR